MKYLAIIYGNAALWASFNEEELAELIAAHDAFNARYAASGELLGAYGLGDELTAKTVRVRSGETQVTDGPYIEAKEHVGGFTVLEAEDLDPALRWATRYAAIIGLPIEVRPFRAR